MLEPRCRGRGLALALVAGVGVAACGSSGASKPDAGDGGPPPGTPQKVVILHTNDIHSHLMGFAPEIDYTPASPGDDATRGGMARLATAIGTARTEATAAGTPVLLLDAGDFMMGTLFELIATQASSELAMMHGLGYDATTIGNHELDWTPHGLAGILQAAVTNDVTIPVLSSNMNFSAGDPGDDELAALADHGVIQPKLIKMVGGLKVGLFGLIGANAVQVTPQAAPLTFDPIAVAAARMVKELRETDQVDLVVALSHSGIDHNGQGEDAVLAAQVPGIDVIISGHTHDTLAQPAQVGNTLIVTAGAYTAYLGELALTVTPSGTPGGQASVTVDSYTLLNIDDTIAGDATTQAAVDSYNAGVDNELAPSGLAYKQVVATTAADLPLPARGEAPVGNLVTDAYLNVTQAVQPTAPPVIAVDANGALRAPITAGKSSTPGKIWLADLFRITPLGIGPDQIPGYSLVTFYLNAKDIRSGLELGGAPEVVSNDYFLQVSGLKVTYDMTKPLFGRVSSLTLVPASGPEQPLNLDDTTTCYKVVTTSYVAGLLGAVQALTGNLLSVTAKDSDCLTPVDPTTRFVDADPTTTAVEELKHWQAVLKYVSGLPVVNGASVPDLSPYAAPQGRIVVQP
jgi:5'-nucleotidase/UDP-sugar diphosphatase